MYIKIKGFSGYHNCRVTPFYKNNFDYLKDRIKNIYRDNVDFTLPEFFWEIETIKDLKLFVKEYLVEYIDVYPYGFKYINGLYCLYESYF